MTLVAAPERHDAEPQDPAGSSASPRRRGSTSLLLAVTVATGSVLRFWAPGALWLDEAITVDISRLPIAQIGPALRADGHPPLSYLLLHVWMGLFGTSDLAVRSLAGTVAMAALPLCWAAARRLGGTETAVAAVILLASSPFAIRYATEARMYALVTFLALAGYLAAVRAIERPTIGRLITAAVTAAALIWTHYWGLWLVATAVVLLAARARRDPAVRTPCLWTLGAVMAGAATFVFWLPTLAYQARHTGTPWAKSVEPLDATFDTMLDFGGGKWPGGRVLGPCLVLLVLLALLGRPLDRWRVVLDLRTVGGARVPIGIASASMALGLGAAVVVSSAYQPRYAAGAFVFVVLAAAVGVGRLPHPDLRTCVLAAVAVVGLAGAVYQTRSPRTQAADIATVLAAEMRPGDVVGYCPDQLRPAVQRELVERGLAPTSLTYPSGNPSGRVDWIDYLDRIEAEPPEAFARRLDQAAGPAHAVWLVESDTYRGFGSRCDDVRAALTVARGQVAPTVDRSQDAYERAELRRFAPT